MDSLTHLWLPIVVASIGCFIMSALIWMIAPHHKGEWVPPPEQDAIMDLLRKGGVTARSYTFPHVFDMKDKAAFEAAKAKTVEGPAGVLYIRQKGAINMGAMMGQQFVFFLVVNVCIALLAGHTVYFAADRAHIAKAVFLVAMMAYLFASIPESIWFARPWKNLTLQAIDAVLYSAVSAAAWCLLWPQ